MTAEIIADLQCSLGECPLWHPQERCLYWVDITRSRLHRLTPAKQKTETFETGAPVGGFTLQENGALLLFMARGAVQLWRNGFMQTVIESLPEEQDNRFNDVIADPEGRVFCGTLTSPTHSARLYRLDPDRTVTQLLDGIGTSNGMGFTPDLSGLYYTDTRKRTIYLFEYDRSTGAICRKRVFAEAPEGDGRPDGLTVDSEGCVWSARWDGGCVVRYSPEGRELDRITLPARRVTSVAFGGEDYRDLYITTAGGDDRRSYGPGAGALFLARPGVCGRPEFASRIA
jgi:D-xylonolactonase